MPGERACLREAVVSPRFLSAQNLAQPSPLALGPIPAQPRRSVISAISGGTASRIGGPVVPKPALTYIEVFPECTKPRDRCPVRRAKFKR